jgi:hypothetical protein
MEEVLMQINTNLQLQQLLPLPEADIQLKPILDTFLSGCLNTV